jgi:hypothetical protein
MIRNENFVAVITQAQNEVLDEMTRKKEDDGVSPPIAWAKWLTLVIIGGVTLYFVWLLGQRVTLLGI